MLLKEPGRQPQNKASASAHLFKNISLGETTNTFGPQFEFGSRQEGE
jgi:hypothetical protein